MIRVHNSPFPSLESAYAHASNSVDLVWWSNLFPSVHGVHKPGLTNLNTPNGKPLQPPADVTAVSLVPKW